jgi:hypothetical protein
VGALTLAQSMAIAAAAIFADTASVPSNDFGTAASFPTYSQAVESDGPLLYHRLDDASGSTTAADSSGNDRTGVYTPGSAAENVAMVVPFDEGAGTTTQDLSGGSPAHDATLNGATWTSAGRFNSAVALDGTDDYVSTAGAVVDTTASFSVSVWAYLTTTASHQTAVSQISQTGSASAFFVQYHLELNRWGFLMPQFDSSDFASPVDSAVANDPPQLNTWTHLLGVFDASAGEILLYVNGVAQGAPTPHTNTWNATGPVEIGSGRFLSTRLNYLSGRIDEVRLYTGVVTPAGAVELAAGVTSGASMSWGFDEGTGTSTQDVSGNANPGALTNGAGWTAGQSGSAVLLDGADDFVEADRSAVHTDQSFTVTAWAFPTATGDNRAVVSQDGTSISGFYLQYQVDNDRWALTMFAADSSTAPFAQAFSTGPPALNTWAHLAGVYDDEADQLRLYVNGAPQGTAPFTGDWDASGPTVVGRSYFGVNTAHFAGAIDEVRLHQRALTANQVAAVHAGHAPGSVRLGDTGALVGAESSSTAAAFSTTARNGYNPTRFVNPTTFTLECWFRSSGPPAGGEPGTLLSFGSAASGDSASHDRQVYLATDGNVGFGSASGTSDVVQSTGGNYLDGAWHHVAAVLDPTTGMALYLDGQLVASRSYVAPGDFAGYWRWGGDTQSAAWPPGYFLGTLDEVAVYPVALSPQRVAAHYYANR